MWSVNLWQIFQHTEFPLILLQDIASLVIASLPWGLNKSLRKCSWTRLGSVWRMTERDKLKISDVLTELSGQFRRDVSLSLVQSKFIIQFVSPDTEMCICRVGGGCAVRWACVCVSACASSELMGHDKWKNNQCALASGFISMLPLSGPAAAENRQNQRHLAKPERILSAQSGSCQSQDPPSLHTHACTHKHCGGVKGHKRHRLVLAVVAECQCCRRGCFRSTFFTWPRSDTPNSHSKCSYKTPCGVSAARRIVRMVSSEAREAAGEDVCVRAVSF